MYAIKTSRSVSGNAAKKGREKGRG